MTEDPHRDNGIPAHRSPRVRRAWGEDHGLSATAAHRRAWTAPLLQRDGLRLAAGMWRARFAVRRSGPLLKERCSACVLWRVPDRHLGDGSGHCPQVPHGWPARPQPPVTRVAGNHFATTSLRVQTKALRPRLIDWVGQANTDWCPERRGWGTCLFGLPLSADKLAFADRDD